MWLALGERGFDTAWEYQTQWAISKAVRSSGIPRSDIFIETKIPCSVHGGSHAHGRYFPPYMTPEESRAHFHEDLKELDMEYVDLLVLHEPCDYLAPYAYNASKETAGVYAVLEEALANGTAKAIGVSNFRRVHFEALANSTTNHVVPAVNQARLSLGNVDWDTVEYCRQHNITYQVYSPLHYAACDGVPASSSPTLQRIATAHNVSYIQVMLRWMSQHGWAIVTATNKTSHATSDIHIYDFTLTQDQLNALDHCRGKKENENLVV
jgi:diketogulonate reductase-like aldo/keto reductase